MGSIAFNFPYDEVRGAGPSLVIGQKSLDGKPQASRSEGGKPPALRRFLSDDLKVVARHTMFTESSGRWDCR